MWEFLNDHVHKGSIQPVPELKESTKSHVSSADQETLHAIDEHAITRFENMIHVSGMHINEFTFRSTSVIFSPGGQNSN